LIGEPVPPWWPHRERSSVVVSRGLHWHLQRWPAPVEGAETALLLHGTGSSAHSFRGLAPELARRFEVIVPDLPGHGFTRSPPGQALTLPAVAAAVLALLRQLRRRPALVVGHSAGAAVAARLVLDSDLRPRRIVAVNGALLPIEGPIGRLFSPAARLLAANPLVAPGFAAWASWPGSTRRLLEGTGSRIDPLGERCYRALVGNPRHAAGALRLMAAWDLEPLRLDLPRLPVPLRLLVGSADRTLPPSHAGRVQELLPTATVHELPGLGHLAHEEDAARVAEWCLAEALPGPRGERDARARRSTAGAQTTRQRVGA